MAFLDKKGLKALGLKAVGENASISDKASFYNPGNIVVGDSVRIDDFCIISAGPGGVYIGNNVHIACYCSIVGQGRVILEEFSGISARVSIFSSNDDYSGEHMTGPTIPKEYRNVDTGDVIIGKHSVIGVGTVILPNVTIETGVAVGALSLVRENCREFSVYAGCPARFLKKRSRRLLALAEEYFDTRK